MTNIPLPLISAPGRHPQAAGGRLINCYPEKLAGTASTKYAYPRVPGTLSFKVTSDNNFRGGIFVGGFIYFVSGIHAYSLGPDGALVQFSGTVPGTQPCFFARDNAVTPHIVVVSPGFGAFVLDQVANAVTAYPAGVNNWGTPNAVDFLLGFFFFTYGNGKTQASGVNSTSIDTTMFATAESKADTLYRPIPLGNGQLLLCGSNSIEVWGGANTSGYPLSYVSTINRGIIGPYAMNGAQDGFNKGLFFVSDDHKTYTLNGYTPQPISTTDIDLLVERDPNKTQIRVGTYVANGHGFVVVQGTGWCWEYETDVGAWHERRSYLQTYWRGTLPLMAWNNQWYCGDYLSNAVLQIDGNTYGEGSAREVQTLTTSGTPTGGTFTLTFRGSNSAAIAYNATAAQVQAALGVMPTLAGLMTCSGGPLPSPVTINFVNPGPQPNLALGVNLLTGGSSPTASIAETVTGITPAPLRIRIETGPFGQFPQVVRINALELLCTKGTGIAPGIVEQIDPTIEISISRDGGQVWSNPRIVRVGKQSLTDLRVRSSIWGQANIQGVRWRVSESAPVPFLFMGADMNADVLR